MRKVFNMIAALMVALSLCLPSLSSPVFNASVAANPERVASRASNTCADPSLARVIYQAFSGSVLSHVLLFRFTLVNANSRTAAGPPFWTFPVPMFQAWPTQQPFTVPLFRLTAAGSTDNIHVIGADAQTPPVVAGFAQPKLVMWVYDSPVCGSVPLMSAVLASSTDHYWTTDPDEQAGLLSSGWTDGGVVAYVLPLPGME